MINVGWCAASVGLQGGMAELPSQHLKSPFLFAFLSLSKRLLHISQDIAIGLAQKPLFAGL